MESSEVVQDAIKTKAKGACMMIYIITRNKDYPSWFTHDHKKALVGIYNGCKKVVDTIWPDHTSLFTQVESIVKHLDAFKSATEDHKAVLDIINSVVAMRVMIAGYIKSLHQ